MKKKEEYQKNLLRVTELAEEHGYRLNSDAARVEKVVGLMTKNFMEYKKYYCPCKQSHPLDPEKDTLCPCDPWKEEIEKDSHCFCRLFYKK